MPLKDFKNQEHSKPQKLNILKGIFTKIHSVHVSVIYS